jgi:hypothetical protein
MASRGRVYLETTVVSSLAARPSRDVRVAAHQEVTSDWWVTRREDFELFVAQLVIEEASAGDTEATSRRLPAGSEEDALHIALAAVHGMTYLLTWSCKPIANAAMRSRIMATCAKAGYEAPVVCTPEELLEG